jgi:hypothetical protein
MDELLKLMHDQQLTELYVPGFTDNEDKMLGSNALPNGAVIFSPMPRDVYLQFGKRLVHFSSRQTYFGMGATLVDKIECSFDNDPDFGFGVAPLLGFVLQCGRGYVRVTKLDAFWEEGGTDPDQCTFAALGLMCDSGDYIFIDPLSVDGIHVGSARMREVWERRWSDHAKFTYGVRSYDVSEG